MNRKTLKYGTLGILCMSLIGTLLGFTSGSTDMKIINQNKENKMSKTIIVYYSYTNHTKMIAERIQKETGYNMVSLELVQPYPDDYQTLEALAKKQADEGFVAEIKPLNIDLSKYDTIILGTPVWWYTFAPAVRGFLKKYDLSNKTIIPYATNAGWLGHTFKDIKMLCPKSVVKDELSIKFSGEAKENKILTPDRDIVNWIDKIRNS